MAFLKFLNCQSIDTEIEKEFIVLSQNQKFLKSTFFHLTCVVMFCFLRENVLNVSDITGTTFVLWKTNTAKRKEFCFIIRSLVRKCVHVFHCSRARIYSSLYSDSLIRVCWTRNNTMCNVCFIRKANNLRECVRVCIFHLNPASCEFILFDYYYLLFNF